MGSSNGRFQPCGSFISPPRAAASSPAACARLDRSGDISQPSNPADRATRGNRLRYVSTKQGPCLLEICPGLVERFGGVARALAGVTAGIESATPLPRIGIVRVAVAH